MDLRRIFAQPDDLIEILDPAGQSVLKVRVLQGSRGNTQVLVYSQPIAFVRLDPPAYGLDQILAEDWAPGERKPIDIVIAENRYGLHPNHGES